MTRLRVGKRVTHSGELPMLAKVLGPRTAVWYALDMFPDAGPTEIAAHTRLPVGSVKAVLSRLRKGDENEPMEDGVDGDENDTFVPVVRTHAPPTRASSGDVVPTLSVGSRVEVQDLLDQDLVLRSKFKNTSKSKTLVELGENEPVGETQRDPKSDPAETSEDPYGEPEAVGSQGPSTGSHREPQPAHQNAQGGAFALTPPEPKGQAQSATVGAVWEAWKESTGHPKSVLDPKRSALISRALKTHGLETCLAAAKGVALDPFSMGENDRKTRYDGVDIVFRDAAHVEKFAALAQDPGLDDMNWEALHKEWQDLYDAQQWPQEACGDDAVLWARREGLNITKRVSGAILERYPRSRTCREVCAKFVHDAELFLSDYVERQARGAA